MINIRTKTAETTSRAALLALALGLLCAPEALSAEEATLPSPGPAAAPVFVPAAQPIASEGTSPSPSADGSSAPLPGGPTPADNYSGGAASAGTSGGLTKSPATPQAVTDAVSRLQKTDNINLDDMIRAQDAINRLDLLLEIEKRQAELKKLRDDRDKTKSSSLLGGIPASALNLPQRPVMSAMPAPVFTPPKSEDYVVQRVTGSEGRYMAMIEAGSETLTVRVGDKLPNGSKVSEISLNGVVIKGKGKSKTLTLPSDAYIVRGAQTSAAQ